MEERDHRRRDEAVLRGGGGELRTEGGRSRGQGGEREEGKTDEDAVRGEDQGSVRIRVWVGDQMRFRDGVIIEFGCGSG